MSSTRQIQLTTDVSASGVFDGSSNLTLNAELSIVQTLPHYDGTTTPTGSYTKVVVDAKVGLLMLQTRLPLQITILMAQ